MRKIVLVLGSVSVVCLLFFGLLRLMASAEHRDAPVAQTASRNHAPIIDGPAYIESMDKRCPVPSVGETQDPTYVLQSRGYRISMNDLHSRLAVKDGCRFIIFLNNSGEGPEFDIHRENSDDIQNHADYIAGEKEEQKEIRKSNSEIVDNIANEDPLDPIFRSFSVRMMMPPDQGKELILALAVAHTNLDIAAWDAQKMSQVKTLLKMQEDLHDKPEQLRELQQHMESLILPSDIMRAAHVASPGPTITVEPDDIY